MKSTFKTLAANAFLFLASGLAFAQQAVTDSVHTVNTTTTRTEETEFNWWWLLPLLLLPLLFLLRKKPVQDRTHVDRTTTTTDRTNNTGTKY